MNFLNIFQKPERMLPLVSMGVVLVLITCSHQGVLPFGEAGLMLLSVFLLGFSLARPLWAFWLLMGLIPLEAITLLELQIGIDVRPYQLVGLALGISFITRQLTYKKDLLLFRWKWFDSLLILFIFAGFFSSYFSSNIALSIKESLIAASFVYIYFLVRTFIRSLEDFKAMLPYIIGSGMIVLLYAIYQNWAFMHTGGGQEVMPGRPNATFAEADWLGMYNSVIIALILSLYFLVKDKIEKRMLIGRFILVELLIISMLVLILSVARSAWLGALFVFVAYLGFVLWKSPVHIRLQSFIHSFLVLLASSLVAMVFIMGLNLTNFELTNRLQSTSSGLQEITIACEKEVSLPQTIHNVSELDTFDCKHINLEEIVYYSVSGHIIEKIYRDDPNVSIRKEIYLTSLQEIKENPLMGIGWGSIGDKLGTDGQGTQLNASNIFLEAYLGAGLVGIASLVVVIGFIILRSFALLSQKEHYFVGVGILLTSLAIIIPNLFNSGQFLGFFWIWLGTCLSLITISLPKKHDHRI